MVTAWLTASVDLMDAALPDAHTINRLRGYIKKDNATVAGVIADYDVLRDIAFELSLLCATALSCWADHIGVDAEHLLRDIALSQAQYAHETE